jgi:hypothetical protein
MKIISPHSIIVALEPYLVNSIEFNGKYIQNIADEPCHHSNELCGDKICWQFNLAEGGERKTLKRTIIVIKLP